MRFSIYSCPVTAALLAGDSITITFPVAITTRIAIADEFSAVLNPIVIDAQDGKTSTSSAPSLSLTTTTADTLIVGTVGVAGDSTDGFVQDSGNAWQGLTRAGTTGGSFTANRTINTAYRSVPAANTFTYAPVLATSSSWIEFLVAYEAS
jgi:hypothetical protein